MTSVNYFDYLASEYDEKSVEINWQPNKVLRTIFDKAGDTFSPHSILDLGAGTGMTVNVLLDCYPDAIIDAYEPSQQMICAARHRDTKSVRWSQQGINNFLKTKNKYDLITVVGVLEFVSNAPELVDKLLLHLNPGGRLYVTYEPLVDGLADQGDAVSETESPTPDRQELRYRYHVYEFEAVIEKSRCQLRESKLFVGYQRRGAAVIYHIVGLQQEGNIIN